MNTFVLIGHGTEVLNTPTFTSPILFQWIVPVDGIGAITLYPSTAVDANK